MHLKRIYILVFLDVLSYRSQVSSVVSFRISVALLVFFLKDLSIEVSGVLKVS